MMGYRKCRHIKPDLKIDDPVWVSNGGRWRTRHFAKWCGEDLLVWVSGRTSHTTGLKKLWKHYRLTDPKGE